MKTKTLLQTIINFLYKKLPCLSSFFLNHLILFLFSILLPIGISGIYTWLINHANQDHLLFEIVAFITWFAIATLIDYLFISVLSKDNIKTKESADRYKYWLSIIYFFALTFMSFLSIDKLIDKENYSIIAFLITISFGSLSPTATYVFRNHTDSKDDN